MLSSTPTFRKRSFSKCVSVQVDPDADPVQRCLSLMEHLGGGGSYMRESIALNAIGCVLTSARSELLDVLASTISSKKEEKMGK